MSKWMKIKGTLINLDHVMLINKLHKVVNYRNSYYIDLILVEDIMGISIDTTKNVKRITCIDQADMDKTFNDINEFLKGESSYYERND